MDYLEMAIKRVTKTLTSLILIGFFREVLGTQESLAVSVQRLPICLCPQTQGLPHFQHPPPEGYTCYNH